MYPALVPLTRTPRLSVVDWTDAPRRFKWTRPFRRKTKSGFCACASTFQLASTKFNGCSGVARFWTMASSFTRFLDHTQRRTTVGRTYLDEWSARRRNLYLTTHNNHNKQTSMPPVGFEPTSERPQTYALDRAATGTGNLNFVVCWKYFFFFLFKIFILPPLRLCRAGQLRHLPRSHQLRPWIPVTYIGSVSPFCKHKDHHIRALNTRGVAL